MSSTYACRICGNSGHRVVVNGIRDWEYGAPGEYSYLECSRCRTLQIHPFPTLEQLIEAYDVDYHGYAPPGEKGAVYKALYRAVDLLSNRELKRLLRDREAKILDVGCGIGLYLDKLRALGYPNVEGIDFNAKAAGEVREKGISCHHGTFLDFEAPAGSYDLIVMNNYLEHTLNPLAELRRACSFLRPGGWLMCETPNFRSLDRMLFGRFWGGNHVPRHTFQYTENSMRRLLTEAGFTRSSFSFPLNTSHFALSFQNFRQRNLAQLRNNPGLVHGRDRLYPFFMLALIPLNLVAKLVKLSGFMQFRATREKDHGSNEK